MSLYFGKDNENKNILHLTKDPTSENLMKSGRQPSTFFLSSESNGYFTVERFPITVRTSSYSYSLKGEKGGNTLGWFSLNVSYPYTGSASDKYTFISNLPVSASKIVSDGKMNGDIIFFLDSSGKVIPEVSPSQTVFAPSGTNPSTGSSTNFKYSASNNTLGFCVAGNLSTVKSNLDRVKEVVVLKTVSQEPFSGPIHVSKNDFLIGGVSIFKERNIGIFTSSPISIENGSVGTILPGLMISNSKNVKSVSLVSNPLETYIALDGTKVFSKDIEYTIIGGPPVYTNARIEIIYNTPRSNASILNLRSIVGAGAKHVILKTSISFFASKKQSYDPNNNIHLGFLILMDTSSDLVVSHFGWDSEGPGGSCRGSTYVDLRYTSDGHIRVSNPKIDYRCYSKYPWYQQLWLNNVEIYVI